MPMDRSKYPADWPAISKRVRERAGQRCEQCKVPNGKAVVRGTGHDAGTYMLEDGKLFDAETGEPRGSARGSEYEGKPTVIVLTVAHLDRDPSGTDESRMRAWCQLHHLRYDRDQHTQSARATRRGRKAAGNLPGVE